MATPVDPYSTPGQPRRRVTPARGVARAAGATPPFTILLLWALGLVDGAELTLTLDGLAVAVLAAIIADALTVRRRARR